jgi:hypothetical protein
MSIRTQANKIMKLISTSNMHDYDKATWTGSTVYVLNAYEELNQLFLGYCRENGPDGSFDRCIETAMQQLEQAVTLLEAEVINEIAEADE